jgi:cytochrome c553
MRSIVLGAAIVVSALLAPRTTSGADDNLMALGRHLAQECTPCHRLDGVQTGIPSIIGLEPDYFVQTMSFYKNGQRNNPAMVSVAQSLDDQQIKALAVYLGTLPKSVAPGKKSKQR